MNLAAGDLDKRISIERSTPTQDAHGNDVDAWAPLSPTGFWARVFYSGGQERRAAAQENASIAATFVVRRTPTTASVTAADRVVFDGAIWNISNAIPSGRDGWEITATSQLVGDAE